MIDMFIAITGSFGSGKSVVAKMFRAKGAFIVSADDIVRKLYRPGTATSKKVAKAFPDAINGGQVSRARLAEIIFSSRRSAQTIAKIVHPAVRAALVKMKKRRGVVVAEVPLLFEARMDDIFDKTVVVYAERAMQIKRLSKKYSRKHINQTLAMQIDARKKLAMADYVIDNSRSRKATRKQVDIVWQDLTRKK